MIRSSSMWRVLGILPLLAAGTASAAIIDLQPNPANGFYDETSEGNDRGVLFTVAQDFSITSVGIEAPLADKSFDVQIYDGDVSGLASPVWATETVDVPVDNGSWFDVFCSFNFLTGHTYTLMWGPTDGVANDWLGGPTAAITLYYLPGSQSSDDTEIFDEFNNLLLTLTAGRVYNANTSQYAGNIYAPRFRFNGPVPEPATVLLLIAGGAVMLRRGRKSATT
ncbi:MAG: PEP-CTERM sorting domain-containing protein [Phycisphaeraceae bacterium]|nr:PEP-CTERM sorting domain-containing protein [Phycisphaeraceae bacterium]